MIVLAGIIFGAVVVLITSDVISYRSLKMAVYAEEKDRSDTLERLKIVTKRIEDLSVRVEARKKGDQREKEEFDSLLDLETVVFEEPYTRISIASGRRYIVASQAGSGMVAQKLFFSEEISRSKEFRQSIIEDVADAMFALALKEYRRYILAGTTMEERPILKD